MKKRTLTSLKNELWTLTSKWVRSQREHCFTCGKHLPDFKDRQAGHFWSRGGHDSVRFNLDNLRIQCVTCNNFKSGNLAEYAIKLRAEIGNLRFDELNKQAHQITKRNRDWYFAEISKLKSLLNDLPAN